MTRPVAPAARCNRRWCSFASQVAAARATVARVTSPAVTYPTIPRRARRPRRRLRTLLLIAATMIGVPAGAGLWLVVSHFHSTPTFAEHLRDKPVADERFAARLAKGTDLGDKGAWAIGSVAPFALTGDDAKYTRDRVRFELELRHGADVLLHSVQELAMAEDAATGQRLGVAARTAELVAAPRVRAVARIYLHDVEHLLEPGAGAVTFDVLVGAGDRPAEAAVVAVAADALAPLAPASAPQGMIANLIARLWPASDSAGEGVLHHLRWSTTLGWRRLPDGSPGGDAQLGDLVHEVSTYEYSYEINVHISVRGGRAEVSRTACKQSSFSWNGTVW